MKKIFLLLISIFTTVSASADPFSFSNFYVDGFGGFNMVNSFKIADIRADLDTGYVVGGALGYRFSKFFRLEGEAAYRDNSFNQFVVEGVRLSTSGHLKQVSAMGNGIIELPFFEKNLIPYCGGGVGNRWEKESFRLDPVATDEGILVFPKVGRRGHGAAYQGIAGLIFTGGYNFQGAIEYRYQDGPDMHGNHTLDLNVKRYF